MRRRLIAAVVLAAGAASRFGSPKQQLLLPEVLARVRASRSVDEIVVVLGAHEVETDARVVRCPEWERGPGASLRCGFAALPAEVEAAVVILADGPDLDPGAIDRVVEAWRESGAEVVKATYGDIALHPVVIARSAWSRVPDEGARRLEGLLVPADDLSPPGDVDRADDLPERLRPPSDES